MAAKVLRAMMGTLSWRKEGAPLPVGLRPAFAAPTGTAALFDDWGEDADCEEGGTTSL